jgi:hypothetical protein
VHLEQALPPTVDAGRIARGVFFEALPGRVPAARLEDALVVASEFVGIAVERSTDDMLLTVDLTDDHVRFTIHDIRGPAAAVVDGLDHLSRRIVDEMCDRWGTVDGVAGVDVWFELSS